MWIFQHQQTDKFLLLNPYIILVIITLFLAWILNKRICSSNPSTTKLPPSPPKLPILGNLHQLTALTHRSLRSLSTKHGPIMLLHFGTRPVIVVQSVDAAKEILKTHDLIFATKPELRTTKRLLYNARNISVAPYGDYWRKLKSVCVLQLLSSRRVVSFSSIREEETALLVKNVGKCYLSCSSVNLSGMLLSLTNDVICRAAFGRKYSGGDEGKKFLVLLRELLRLLGSVSVGDFIPWLWWINRVDGFDRRVDRVAKEIDEFLEMVIEEHLNGGFGEKRENFVDILLDIWKDNMTGVDIDRVSIKAIILDVIVGGTDTAFATLEWAMTELLRNQKIMKKLQNEVRTILQQKQDIKDEDLEKLPYLKAVIIETFRYHIPVPFLAREPQEDVEIMGYHIAKGTMVIINSWAIARDPATWDEPEKFEPERFLNCSIDFQGLDFELLPFGAGRRRCPGIAFAMANVDLVLANLVQKFDWELPKGEELDCIEDPGVTLHRKNPLFAVPIQCYF